ncbi:STY0301 family protein [Sphingomonas sp. ASY06-1R]|uniref:STY0301 family protein n=1 Tax=Sphingomonas sp. ASY06-1R TaxID=3445771 RepID=UPI003FA2D8D0
MAACLALGPIDAAPPLRAVAPTPRPITLTCPAHLSTTQSAPAVPNWESYRSTKGRQLNSFGFYDGPVAGDAELAPSDGTKRDKIKTSIYSFEGHLQPIHFACRYRGTDIILSRPLPARIRQCSIRSNATQARISDSVVTCR